MSTHLIHLTEDGRLKDDGSAQSTSQTDLVQIVADMAAMQSSWAGQKPRVVLYAHGGNVAAADAVTYANWATDVWMNERIYPLFFIWRSDPLSSFVELLMDRLRNVVRPKGLEDLLIEAFDKGVEAIARKLVTPLWAKMKANALGASTDSVGGAKRLAALLTPLVGAGLELNLVGHSAGGIFHAPLVKHLVSDLMLPVHSATLWAPGTRMDLFKSTYVSAFANGLQKLSLYTLPDATERTDALVEPSHKILVYHKSILYLVSNALEGARAGTGILGMARFASANSVLTGLLATAPDRARWIQSSSGSALSAATSHTGFTVDTATLTSTMDGIKAA